MSSAVDEPDRAGERGAPPAEPPAGGATAAVPSAQGAAQGGAEEAGLVPVVAEQVEPEQIQPEPALDAPASSAPRPSDPELPRGASAAELDSLRVSLRKVPKSLQPGEAPSRLPAARAPSLPLPGSMLHKAELDRLIDEGRALLESDTKAAHALFERAWLRNLNDVRVLSHFGLTLVLVDGDRQRGIRFCEEAVRRGPPTSEFLINLARALVQTRNKEQAVRALKRAGELAPTDPRVQDAFELLGLRRRPPIPFLPRSFFLNRWLGRLTWRLRRHRVA